ncbi:cell surface glycoprotein CD200 receptor 1-like isoform X2 [Ranitomeya variabilis]|uniref:cell surface glycoprotein CD200 receptor 1-like isoform X2 n=1 Tax=Ranitomeya variabilis TaxID=490064 RepID=UPI00405669DF
MKPQDTTRCTLQLILLVCVNEVKTDFLRVHVGDEAVLHCIHSIKNFTMITWKVHFLNQPYCYLSTIGHDPKGNCSSRMHLDVDKNQTSLRIPNSMAIDDGNYTCDIANGSGNFFHSIVLQVLAEPFVTINVDENGHQECHAIGGNPAANISWTPESEDKVETWNKIEINGTTTVFSSYNTSNITEVTCIVSHPTFPNPIQRRLSRLVLGAGPNHLILSVSLILVFVLFLGILLFWQRSYIRTCLSVNTNSPTMQENPVMFEEVEPYASFTEKVNTIYSTAGDFTEYKGTQQTRPDIHQ